MYKDIELKLIPILKNKNIDLECYTNELNLDSLDMIDLLLSIEDVFKIEFDVQDLNLNNFNTIENIISTITLKLGE